VQVMMDPLDPMYDDWPDEELHSALLEHLSSQSSRALTPAPSNVVEEGRLLHVILEAHADEDDYTDDDWQHEYLEVDCDVKPDPMLSHFFFSNLFQKESIEAEYSRVNQSHSARFTHCYI
jgi:hypothetical protein